MLRRLRGPVNGTVIACTERIELHEIEETAMNSTAAIGSGFAGALALTALHETARSNLDQAPRMDILGERAIAKSFQAFGTSTPGHDRLHELALAGDVVANSAYYSLVALGDARTAVTRGALLGLAAGIGGVLLPGPLGLGESPSNRSKATQAMTIGWYVFGGVAAGLAYRLLASDR